MLKYFKLLQEYYDTNRVSHDALVYNFVLDKLKTQPAHSEDVDQILKKASTLRLPVYASRVNVTLQLPE